MNRPTHAGLRHLALNARRLEAMTRFYVDVLGFDVEWEPDADNVYLSSGIDNLALIVRAPADVDRWAEFLESRGVVLEQMPRTHRDGARSCYFRDPDGNVVQIIHHPPISAKA
jgi:catechol 2,3-dioxygenase-like lactoylglutathione lyase family enzyme